MEQIRYTQRICNDKEKINRFLIEKRVATLSMCDNEEKPYAIPVNYVWCDNEIFIHGMGSGKKNDILTENCSVCFTIFDEFGTVTDSVPCKCDTSYFSVVIFGKMVLVQDLEEKTRALTKFLDKFTPNLFKTPILPEFIDKYRSSFDNRAVSLYCIKPEAITAKENPVDLEHMFKVSKKDKKIY